MLPIESIEWNIYIYHKKNSTIHVAKKYTSPMGIPMG